eukprot:scaffold22279_cov123-Isochrysis_galbana.AAC.9
MLVCRHVVAIPFPFIKEATLTGRESGSTGQQGTPNSRTARPSCKPCAAGGQRSSPECRPHKGVTLTRRGRGAAGRGAAAPLAKRLLRHGHPRPPAGAGTARSPPGRAYRRGRAGRGRGRRPAAHAPRGRAAPAAGGASPDRRRRQRPQERVPANWAAGRPRASAPPPGARHGRRARGAGP